MQPEAIFLADIFPSSSINFSTNAVLAFFKEEYA
jgi:hypothetical protein